MQTRALTAKDIAGWLTPRQAIEILNAVYGLDSHSYVTKQTLLGRLAGGVILAASGEATIDDSRPLRRILYGLIPAEDWEKIETDDIFWTTGDLTYTRRYGSGYNVTERTVRHYGVKFEPNGVRAIVDGVAPKQSAPSPIQAPETQIHSIRKVEPTANRGGAPRKEWWDDFWVAICGQVYEGDLKPKTQADLERAMLDWASEHGHAISETSAKVAARKLFRAWHMGDKN